MYENIFLTGLVFTILMLTVPELIGKDVPTWIKTAIIIPGLFGVLAMVVSVLLKIWQV